MAKKDKDEDLLEEKILPAVEEEATEQQPFKNTYYKKVKWKGVRETNYCEICGFCDIDEDNMIMHVVKHVPGEVSDALMNQLISTKEK